MAQNPSPAVPESSDSQPVLLSQSPLLPNIQQIHNQSRYSSTFLFSPHVDNLLHLSCPSGQQQHHSFSITISFRQTSLTTISTSSSSDEVRFCSLITSITQTTSHYFQICVFLSGSLTVIKFQRSHSPHLILFHTRGCWDHHRLRL